MFSTVSFLSFTMEHWLLTQCNNSLANVCKTFSLKFSGEESECLIENSSTLSYQILEDEQSNLRRQSKHKKTSERNSFKTTFSFKSKPAKRNEEKVEPVLPPVLQTYNRSLFKENNSWL